MRPLSRLLVLCSLPILAITASAQQWQAWGSLNVKRATGTVAALSPTSAIVVGGFPVIVIGSQHYGPTITRSCEIIDIATHTVRYTDSTAVPHAEGPIVRMPNGHVFVLGGLTNGNRGTTTLVEEFDPVTEKWQTRGNLLLQRRQQQAIAMDDYRIMIVTGRDASLNGTSAVEIFDTRSGLCVRAKDHPHTLTNAECVKLDEKIYVIGGRESGPNSPRYKDVYYYDEVVDTWILAYNLPKQLMGGGFFADGSQAFEAGGTLNTKDDVFSDAVYRISPQGATLLPGRLADPKKAPGLLPWSGDSLICFGGDLEDRTSATSSNWINTRSLEITPGPSLITGRVWGMYVALEGNAVTGPAVLAIGGLLTDNEVTPSIEILARSVCSDSELNVLANPAMLKVVGNAKLVDSPTRVQLTGPVEFNAGAIWYKGKLGVGNGLTTSFSFKLAQGMDNGQPDGGDAGADGVALVVQNQAPSPLGQPGQGIGYEGIQNAVAVEFDAYLNAAFSDPAGSHVAVQSSKHTAIKPWHRMPYLLGMTYNIPMLKSDGTIYYAKVDFKSDGIDVFLSTTPKFGAPVLSIPNENLASLIQLDQQGAAWIGITSATGYSVQQHEILAWSIGGCQPLITSVGEASAGNEKFPAQSTYPVIVPMPSLDYAVLRYSSEEDAVTVFIYNGNGVCVWTGDVTGSELMHGIQLPASELSTGVYVVQVVSGGFLRAVKWFVQH